MLRMTRLVIQKGVPIMCSKTSTTEAFKEWCGRRDSNPHASRHTPLKRQGHFKFHPTYPVINNNN